MLAIIVWLDEEPGIIKNPHLYCIHPFYSWPENCSQIIKNYLAVISSLTWTKFAGWVSADFSLLQLDLFCWTDGDKNKTVEEPSPAMTSNRPVSAQVVRPKERPVVCAHSRRKKPSLQDCDFEYRERRHTARVSPPEHHLSKADRKVGERHPHSYRNRHHRRPIQDRTKTPEVIGARVLKVCGEQPSGASFAEERTNRHTVEVTQHLYEAMSTQLERWYERKMDEARLQTAQRTQAERGALVDRITHLEKELRSLRISKNNNCWGGSAFINWVYQ